MPIDYDDIADFRYNSFTGVYSPKAIGYGANPAERYTIPASAPYIIKLYEFPQKNVPSTTVATMVIGGAVLKEVPASKTPAVNEYRVQYEPLGGGQVEFHASKKGLQVDMKYYGLGTIHGKDALDTRVPATGNTTIAGNKTLTGDTIFTGDTLFQGTVDGVDSDDRAIGKNGADETFSLIFTGDDVAYLNLYKPIMILLQFTNVVSPGYFSLLHNASYYSIMQIATGNYVLTLNPGYYRFDAGGGSFDCTFRICGVFGETDCTEPNKAYIYTFVVNP